ncbi:hypothetical protein D777_01525 [Marinobacter nitratireducens]|uniref:Inner membrane protein n=1 Tax=Marinobacter nitratireducens TaxID=1137280 RepID=A0A072N2B7_9GAMM|nr:YbaN family protein [Marinobacter nitratireducens]KEF31839.1 hypothetical protein D777_01525 [Marinobacter nitratireducens]
MSSESGKRCFLILSYVSVGLAVAGIVLPLLPTTPFVLLAAFFASKGSPAFARWLDEHPRYGPIIDNWQRNRVVPVKAKVLACTMMALSWALLFAMGTSAVVLVVVGVFLTCTASYLLTRPSY